MKNFDTDVINRVLKGDSTLEEAQSAVRWMRTKSGQSYLNNVIDKKFQQDETDVTVDVPSAEMKAVQSFILAKSGTEEMVIRCGCAVYACFGGIFIFHISWFK